MTKFSRHLMVQGPSTTWAVIGGVMLAVGRVAMFWSMKPH